MATIKVTSPILKIGAPMANGMIIPSGTVEHIVKKWNEAPWEKFGQLQTDDVEFGGIQLSNVTHKINNVEIKGDYLVADMELIEAPNTKHLVEMLDAHKLYGTCSVMTDGKEVFNLQSISITMNPSDALKNFPLTRVEKDDEYNSYNN
jgi:hypothetical protein